MRLITVVANLAQMAIILLVFLLKGPSLGGWTIFALFLLLIIAFVNLLVLFFHATLSQKDQLPGTKSDGTIIKRQDLRVAYVAAPYPVLSIGKREFSVSDISENGLRIRIGRHEQLKKRFRGDLTLLCKERLDIKATLIRRQGDEAALALKQPLDYAFLLKEKQSLSTQ